MTSLTDPTLLLARQPPVIEILSPPTPLPGVLPYARSFTRGPLVLVSLQTSLVVAR